AFPGSGIHIPPMAFASKYRGFPPPKKVEEDRRVLRLFPKHSRLQPDRSESVRASPDKKRPFGFLLDTRQAILDATMSRAIPRIKKSSLPLGIPELSSF